MANQPVRLSARGRQALRRDLILFLETLEVYLKAGFEMSYAWPECLLAIGLELKSPLLHSLSPVSGERAGLSGRLKRLAIEYPDPRHRHWFAVLAELYASGSPLAAAVFALAETLREEDCRELESHLRKLPTRSNILLMFFFLPPALLLIFAPLVHEMLRGF